MRFLRLGYALLLLVSCMASTAKPPEKPAFLKRFQSSVEDEEKRSKKDSKPKKTDQALPGFLKRFQKSVEDPPPKQEKKKPTKSRFPFARQASNDTRGKEKSSKEKSSTNSTTTATETETPASTNATKSKGRYSRSSKKDLEPTNSSRPPQQQYAPSSYFLGGSPPPQQQPPGQSGVIILNPRGGRPGAPHQGIPMQHTPSSALILIDALIPILSIGLRFWLIHRLARWFADEEIRTLRQPTRHFVWERLNDRYTKDSVALQTALQAPPINVPERKWKRHLRKLQKRQEKERQKVLLDTVFSKTVVVLEVGSMNEKFDVHHLEQIVTFIISEHRRNAFGSSGEQPLEVILKVESPGGEVTQYGLATAQINRLTQEAGITTTVCVDRIAASGGYMIASQANRVLAAPFAMLGSIGVMRDGLNFNKALEKFGVAPMTLTAGENKAPLTAFGKVTKEGMASAQKQLERTHTAFRDLVVEGRPALEYTIEEVSEGDVFLGKEAHNLKLVDEIMTSGEYIAQRVQAGDRVLMLHRIPNILTAGRRLGNPLEFLTEKGPKWLAKQDVKQWIGYSLQATSLVGFVREVIKNRFS